MIPLPMLWRSRLRTSQKIASSFVLGAGIFVLVCATLKSVFVLVVSKVAPGSNRQHDSNTVFAGSCQWRTASRGLGNTRILCCRYSHQPPHDLSAYQTLAVALVG